MADEAYRAVFLRVHPTGKMVLSLTTDSDGNEPALRGARRPASSVSRRSTSRSSPRTPTASASVTATTRARPPGAPAAIASATREDPRQGAAARGHGARRLARERSPGRTAPGSPATAPTPRRSRRSRTSPSTRTAPARCRPASRAGSTRRPSTATDGYSLRVEHDLDLVGDLQRPEQGGVGLHAPAALRDDGGGAERPVVGDREVERDRPGRAGERQVALHAEPAAVGRCSTPVERNMMSWRLRTSSSIVWWMLALSSSPSACIPPVPFCTRSEVGVGGRARCSSPRGRRRPRASPPRR